MTATRRAAISPLGEATGPIGLRGLADEDNRQPGDLGGDDRERYTAQLKTGEHVHISRQQANQPLGDLAQQARI